MNNQQKLSDFAAKCGKPPLCVEGEFMEQNEIRKLLQNVANGDILVDDALLHIKNEPFEDLGYAKPDFHRKSRQGVSEVIYGAGKTAEQIIGISKSFAEHGQKRYFNHKT